MSLRSTVGNVDRMGQISLVLIKHGFGELWSRMGFGGKAVEDAPPNAKAESAGAGAGSPSPDAPDAAAAEPPAPAAAPARRKISFAERLRLALQDLGPSFVKLGQIISTRPDLIPADVIVELKKLQDRVPPIPVEDVRREIESSLGAKVEDIFEHFDPTPLASASIGQVHRARLRVDTEVAAGGAAGAGSELHEVVIKVQRPKIRGTIERDLDLLFTLAKIVERTIPESRIYSPTGLVKEFDRAITAELDFTVEAENAERFAKNFAGNPVVCFPKVYRQASSRTVLTLEFFPGKKIYDAVEGGASGETIAKNAVAVIAQMIFADGFFHADPHPGNIIMLGPPEAPVIGLIDLGLVGRLSVDMRNKAVDLMVAALQNDVDGLADALVAMGRPGGKVDMRAFRAEVAVLSEKYLGRPINEIEMSGLLRDLVQGAVKYDIEMPVELIMMGKSLMTVEGIGKEIYPELDIWTEARPFFMKLLWSRYHPLKLGAELLRALQKLGRGAADLPGQVHEILEDLRQGKLQLKTTDPGLPEASDRLGRRIWSGLVIVGTLGSGTALVLAGQGRFDSLATALYALAGATFGTHLWLDWRRTRKKRQQR
ncbi:MAG: AarF/ABC1/UbiB kinase family protein [Deltaproteobacteria bacterium]|nr:AarF/ABC1/UbiB kinase family protein [Deltaproteobacteria bacterium]